MKKGRFLWSAHRITEKQKAGKARNIKEKQLKNSRSTASKPPVVLPSSPSADRTQIHSSKAQKPRNYYGFGVFSMPKIMFWCKFGATFYKAVSHDMK